MDVANNYTCYCQLYRLVPVLFSPVQQFHPTTFFTRLTLCLVLKFLGKFYYVFLSLICNIINARACAAFLHQET